MKKFIFIGLIVIMAVCFVCGFAACGGSSTTFDDTSHIGNGDASDLEYVQRGNEYVVSGIGTYSGTDLVIPSEYKGLRVTAIDDYAFFNNKTLNKVVIPDSVTYIGGYSFYYCKTLTRVNIPVNTISLGECAFYNCTALEEIYYDAVALDDFTASRRVFDMAGIEGSGITVTIGEGVTEIPAYLFCPENGSDIGIIPKITAVIFESDSQCTSIGERAFYNCRYLESLTLPEKLSSIGSNAFYYCSSLENLHYDSESFMGTLSSCLSNAGIGGGGITVTVGKDVLLISDSLFSSFSMLTTVVFEDGSVLNSIGDRAFYNCSTLETIKIPVGVTSIGEYAFSGCTSFTDIVVPDSVTTIGEGAFSGCSSLESITIPFVGASAVATSASSSTLFGYIFGTNSYIGGKSTSQRYSSDSSVTYYVPSALNSVTISRGSVLCYGSFYNCSSITSVTISDSIISIGEDTFFGCSSLTDVYIANFSAWCSIDFGNQSANPLYYDVTLYENDVPVKIENEFAIPEGVTHIGSYAFYSCRSLVSLTIPSSVTSIGEYAFRYCNKLVEVCNLSSMSLYAGSADNGYVAYFAKNIYTYGGSKLSTTDDGYIFYNDEDSHCLMGYTGSETNLSLPGNMGYSYEIYQYGFYSRASIVSVIIPDSVNSIGVYAFSYCTSLMSVVIPSSVTSVANSSFSHCASLTSVNIPDSVTTIGTWAFYGCSSLTSITLPKDLTSIGDWAFSDCTSLSSIVIPDSVIEIGEGAFEGCTCFTSIVIPDSVTTMGAYAFRECSSLASVTIGSGVTSIDNYVFYECTYITEINFNAVAMEDLSSDNRVFYNAGKNGSGIAVTIGAGVTEIPAYLFYPYTYNSICNPYITTLIFEDNSQCTSIGTYSFYGCRSLTSIIIPESVTTIAYSAFDECRSVTDINFNAVAMDDLSEDNYVFCNAGIGVDGVTLTIGANVTKIPAYLFDSHSTTSSTYANNIATVIFEEGSKCTSIGSYAFAYNCKSITSIAIPESVTSIGDYAFYSCSSLTSVYYSGSSSDWSNISKGSNNTSLTSATIYYYSETEPTYDGNFWHYVDGEIIIWRKSD